MIRKLFLFLFVISVGFAFSQQVTGDSLLKMLEKAKNYYNSGEYENAIAQLESALMYLKQLSKNEQVEAYKYLGFSYVAFGDKERAKEQFKKVIALEPKLELDPATVSPKIIKVFEEAKAEMTITPAPQPEPVQPKPVKPVEPVAQQTEVNAAAATLRSCCLPGWGQMYKGENSKGKKMMIATAVLLPTTVIAISLQNAKHERYLEIEPGDEDAMEQTYREYKMWYNVSAIFLVTYTGFYLYNIYDVIASKPKVKSSMNMPDHGFYCQFTKDRLQLGFKYRVE